MIKVMMMMSINFVVVLSVGLTVMYTIRLMYYSLSSNLNSFSYLSVLDCSMNMKISVVIMSMIAVTAGSCMSWIMFNDPLLISVPVNMKIMNLCFLFMGMWIGYEINSHNFWIFKYSLTLKISKAKYDFYLYFQHFLLRTSYFDWH